MNTQKFLVVLVMTIFTILLPQTTHAAVQYPVIGEGLRNDVLSLRATGQYLASEYAELYSDEYVVVSLPSHPEKGMVFRIGFIEVPELGGTFLEPTLTSLDNNYRLQILDRSGFIEYSNGSKEIFGSCSCMGSEIFIYAWNWRHEDGFEGWSVAVTWGEGADTTTAGRFTDRTSMGTLPSEPAFNGHEIFASELDSDGEFYIGMISDADAEINLEATTDFKTWTPIDSKFEPITGSYEHIEGVTFLGIILKPELSPEQKSSSRMFFRIR